ncbi:MAG: type II toxin-antitoxin system VapC family toxin [Promethearchaeota archaeon]|nr:MAG: type II toxin-antitoxin system VapC family toxin [Candidatus Lokiarchaeota archaeon]
MIFLDTSSAIQILKGDPSIREAYEKYKTNQFGITTPSIFELYNGIYKVKYLKKKISKENYKKLHEDLDLLINESNVYPLDEKAARLGAKFHVQLKSKGQEIDVFDCLIAAVIINNGFKEIITNNQKHFEKIKTLIVYSF